MGMALKLLDDEIFTHILGNLLHFTALDEESLKKLVLEDCKSKRKGLANDEILEKGLNIYPKKDISVDWLFEEAVRNGFVKEKYSHSHKKRVIYLTEEGRSFLLDLYTDNYCEDFIKFQDDVTNLMEKANEPEISLEQLASWYWSEFSIDDVRNRYAEQGTLEGEARAYHHKSLQRFGYDLSSSDYFLHLAPKLFLSEDDLGVEVSLSVEGIGNSRPISIVYPYPNKRYAVASFEPEEGEGVEGFYPIVGSKEEFPKVKEIRLHWKLGNGKELFHDIHIQFNFDTGNMFSTNQDLIRRNTVLPHLKLVSIFDDIPYLREDRTLDSVNENGKHYLKETVQLTSFPSYLHYFR